MTFDWGGYIKLAQSLVTQHERPDAQAAPSPLEEAALRSAISRAYYAAYNTAHAYAVERLGFQFARDGDTHHQVWEAIRHHFRNGTTATKGFNLKKARRRADYDAAPYQGDLVREAKQALRDANSVISQLVVRR